MPGPPQTFRAYNGLRFLAALAVVCFHYGQLVAGFSQLPLFVRNMVQCGPVALSFFFILSGFVLGHAYADRLPATPAERKSFWYARFARLYPIYFVAFLLFLPAGLNKYVLQPGPGHHWWNGIVSALVALPALQAWTPFALGWNGPGWSLSVEAFFYFLFPFVAGPALRLRWPFAGGLLLALWAAMLSITSLNLAGILSPTFWYRWIEYNPVFWTPMFLTGVLTFRLYRERGTPPAADAFAAALLGLLVVVCGVLAPTGRQLLLYGAAAPLLAAIVLMFARPSGWMQTAFGGRALFLVGSASYITYITQAPIWHLYINGTSLLTGHPGEFGCAHWQFFSYLALLVTASLLLHRIVEEPAKLYLLRHRRMRLDRLADAGIEAV